MRDQAIPFLPTIIFTKHLQQTRVHNHGGLFVSFKKKIKTFNRNNVKDASLA